MNKIGDPNGELSGWQDQGMFEGSERTHEVPRPGASKSHGKLPNVAIPLEGTPVPSNIIKRAGPYLLGPKLGPSPVKSIVQCLARREGTDEFYLIKILTLRDEGQPETQDDRQGKMLLHTEYSLLSLLEDQDGVIHHHGLFKVIYISLLINLYVKLHACFSAISLVFFHQGFIYCIYITDCNRLV